MTAPFIAEAERAAAEAMWVTEHYPVDENDMRLPSSDHPDFVQMEVMTYPSPAAAVAAVVPILAEHFAQASITAEHLAHQREWSTETFGPGTRLLGVLDHIRKELAEIEADPTDLSEWIDVVILAFDGAWRAGWEPQQIIDAIKAKQARDEARTWPDWRTADTDKAIEHVREAATPTDGAQTDDGAVRHETTVHSPGPAPSSPDHADALAAENARLRAQVETLRHGVNHPYGGINGCARCALTTTTTED